LTRNVGQTDLVLVYAEGLLVGLCVQDYKSLSVAITICVATVPVTFRAHKIRRFDWFILLF